MSERVTVSWYLRTWRRRRIRVMYEADNGADVRVNCRSECYDAFDDVTWRDVTRFLSNSTDVSRIRQIRRRSCLWLILRRQTFLRSSVERRRLHKYSTIRGESWTDIDRYSNNDDESSRQEYATDDDTVRIDILNVTGTDTIDVDVHSIVQRQRHYAWVSPRWRQAVRVALRPNANFVNTRHD